MTIDIHRWLRVATIAAFIVVCNGLNAEETQSEAGKSKWLDEHPKHVGLTWDGNSQLLTNYVWRGLYVGGLCLQSEASVGYGGAFIDAWVNIGPTSWEFSALCPEVDLTVGFARWGFKALIMHMFYFDGMENVTSEVRVGYKVSSKLPLSILWCTRFWARDHYIGNDGEKHRAYSSYIELGYDFRLPWEMTLEARLGMTPWKSFYTGYAGDFAVVNISATLYKEWKMTDFCRLRVTGQLMLNPWHVDKNNVQWDVKNPWNQRLNANLGFGVFFN